MNIESKISQAEVTLQRKLDWVERHDSKTSFATGILIGILGILASASSKIETWHFFKYLIFGISALLLSISLFFIYKCQYPKTKSSNTSLNYFGTISEMKFDEFKSRTIKATDEEYLENIFCQIDINSDILIQKFNYLKTSLILLGIAIVP